MVVSSQEVQYLALRLVDQFRVLYDLLALVVPESANALHTVFIIRTYGKKSLVAQKVLDRLKHVWPFWLQLTVSLGRDFLVHAVAPVNHARKLSDALPIHRSGTCLDRPINHQRTSR
jgi:hypothetical protein